jgi:phenylacetate-CoA ligase
MLRENIYRIIDSYEALKGNESYYHLFSELKKIQKKGKDDINKIMLSKANEVINNAYNNVEYYRTIFKEKGLTAKLSSLEDLEKYPILTKHVIRENFPQKIVDHSRKTRAHYNTTSGSTGEPLEFYNDSAVNPYTLSSFMYFNAIMGVGPMDVHWNLKSTGKYNYRQRFTYWLLGKHVYSVLDVRKENLHQIQEQIDGIRPNYIEGYSASLEKLARLLSEENIPIKTKPKAIIATSENLTESGRALLETVFDSKVFIRYGSREFSGAVAQECNLHEGLHVNPLLTYLEVVDENGENVAPGEQGKVLITDLNNMVMPFIRYDIGDIAAVGQEKCPCGIGFPTIGSIQGRTGEFIISKEDERIPFITISAYLFRRNFTPHVYTYQFVQREKGEILLKVVPTSKYDEGIHSRIEETLRQLLPGFKIELHVVDDIPPEKTGKTPFLKKIKAK